MFKEKELDKISHFRKNKNVYDIVVSALNGNVTDKAAVVSLLANLHSK